GAGRPLPEARRVRAGARGGPGGQRSVQRLVVVAAGGVVDEPRVVDQFRHADRLGEALVGPLRAGGNAYPYSIARLVSIARRVLRQPVALPLLDDPELIEADDLRLDQPEQGLVQADVHFLALAAVVIAVVD